MLSPEIQRKEAILLRLLTALGQSIEAVELAQAHAFPEEVDLRVTAQAVRQAVRRNGGLDSEPRPILLKGGRDVG